MSDGARHGHGVCTYSDDHKYTGEWRDDQKNGRGKYVLSKGDFSEGVWENDKQIGRGKEVLRGCVYEGEFKDNFWHGSGKEIRTDGSFYEGEFKDGKWHGKGCHFLDDGSIYEGEWEEGTMHGRGREMHGDSSMTYEGEYNNDNWHGRGKVSYSSGEVYDGQWIDGQRCVCPDTLTKENIRTLPMQMLVQFWGPWDENKQKSIIGTLGDSREPDLKIGEEALVVALEENEFALGQLCFRHVVTVEEIGAARSAFENQVKFRYKHFASSHAHWITKRSSLLERATKDRLKERAAFNPVYEKVKKHLYPTKNRKRSK